VDFQSVVGLGTNPGGYQGMTVYKSYCYPNKIENCEKLWGMSMCVSHQTFLLYTGSVDLALKTLVLEGCALRGDKVMKVESYEWVIVLIKESPEIL
jgi:hypothetical protein